jgi:hypothetical protein
MKAVNLIPAEQRRGAGGIAGRSGGIVYVVVGALSIVVLLGIVYAFAVRSVADRKGQLADVTAQVDAVQAQSAALAPYVQVEQLRQHAVSSAVGLAEQRFDWPQALRQLALALPSDVTFVNVGGSFGGSASTSPEQAATTTPGGGASFTISGCASSQAEVATVVASLQRVPGVNGVSLQNANGTPNASPTMRRRSAEAKGGQCPHVTFSLTLEYAGTYTLPNQRVATATGGAARTVSRTQAAGHGVRATTMQPAR